MVTSSGTTSCLRDGELMQAARVSPLAQPSLMGYQETMISSALSAERRTTYVYDDKGQVVTVIYPKPGAIMGFFEIHLLRSCKCFESQQPLRNERGSNRYVYAEQDVAAHCVSAEVCRFSWAFTYDQAAGSSLVEMWSFS